jgi:hypothetical protein
LARTLQGGEFIERLQCSLGVARDELRNAQNEQMTEANTSRCPIDSTITAGTKVFLDTKEMPITYANVNPMYCKLAHYYFSPYEIL